MEDELYKKIVENLSEGLDEKAKKRIEEAISTGYKIGINTIAHNFGNMMQDVIYANNLFIQDPTGKGTKEYMNLQRKGLGKLTALIKMLSNTSIKDSKIEEHPPEGLENYIINTDNIMKENGNLNGNKNGK